WAGFAVTAYVIACGWLLWRSRPRRDHDDATGNGSQVLVAWASQTGFAQELAERTAATLAGAGVPVRLRELSQVDAAMLADSPRALFVASTTGEGDPPDPALGFVRDMMATPAALPSLQFAVLALGDREYEQFCGFGHRLDQWLRQSGATPLFDLVEVDNGDAGALRHWQHHLGLLAQAPELPDWSPVAYEPWQQRWRAGVPPRARAAGRHDAKVAGRRHRRDRTTQSSGCRRRAAGYAGPRRRCARGVRQAGRSAARSPVARAPARTSGSRPPGRADARR